MTFHEILIGLWRDLYQMASYRGNISSLYMAANVQKKGSIAHCSTQRDQVHRENSATLGMVPLYSGHLWGKKSQFKGLQQGGLNRQLQRLKHNIVSNRPWQFSAKLQGLHPEQSSRGCFPK